MGVCRLGSTRNIYRVEKNGEWQDPKIIESVYGVYWRDTLHRLPMHYDNYITRFFIDGDRYDVFRYHSNGCGGNGLDTPEGTGTYSDWEFRLRCGESLSQAQQDDIRAICSIIKFHARRTMGVKQDETGIRPAAKRIRGSYGR